MLQDILVLTVLEPLQTGLVEALLNPKVYPHPVEKVTVVETHISWIFLTGIYAYKLKKAIKLELFDASTLTQRIHFCQEELRLNRRLAPQLYLALCQVYGPVEFPSLGADIQFLQPSLANGLDVMVKMLQFPSSNILSNSSIRSGLSINSFKKLGSDLAHFHLYAQTTQYSSDYGSIESIVNPVLANLDCLNSFALNRSQRLLLSEHRIWLDKQIQRLGCRFDTRKQLQSIRECHGDLHLGNIYLGDNNRLEAFDCIDFNPHLRWIDPISEIAFLVVDLQVHSCQKEAMELLDIWLEHTGDYSGLDLLPWYSTYRALVRAKVSGIQIQQLKDKSNLTALEKNKLQILTRDFDLYLQQSRLVQISPPPGLVLMHGLSGSGKSYCSHYLCTHLPAVRLRSDVERKRFFHRSPLHKSNNINLIENDYAMSPPSFSGDPYHPDVSTWLFDQLLPFLASRSLGSQLTTIVDATFLKAAERQRMIQLAHSLGRPIAIVNCECSDDTAERRINKRFEIATDASEADMAVRLQQKRWLEPLSTDERLLTVDFREGCSIPKTVRRVRRLLGL